VVKPGIYTIPADEYHADPTPEPSLSASIAKLLAEKTPMHAWAQHPRLNPGFERIEEEKFDVGNFAHQLILEGEDNIVVVDADSWRTKAAQEEREGARAEGRIALLAKDYARVTVATHAIRAQIAARLDEPRLFSDGKPEQTLVWRESTAYGPIWCRARVDWLHDDFSALDDLKTTAASANPVIWSNKTLWQIGGDVQAAFYRRGVKELTGKEPVFRFVVAENKIPFALGVCSPGPDALQFGDEKVDAAITLWAKCLSENSWPAYPQGIHYFDVPMWASLQFDELQGEMAA
jgi:hypothetical protein